MYSALSIFIAGPSQWSEAREIEELGVRCVGQEDLEAQLIHEAEEAFRQELSERPPQEVSKDGADSLELVTLFEDLL